jgi:acetyl esterase/lipase
VSRDPEAVLSRLAPPPDFTVSYGEHPDQIADVRLPIGASSAAAPLVLFLHGGFWRNSYDRAHTGPLAADLAARGFVVATPEYRRTGAPGGGWPGTLDDVAAATRMVPPLVAGRTAVDLNRVVVAGHSAGGHLALWAVAGMAHSDRGVRGAVALAPVADLRAAYELDLDGGAVAALLGGGPTEVPDRYAATDPMALIPIGARVVIVHGLHDAHVPVELARRFATAAHAAGDEIDLVELLDTEHFGLIDPRSLAWPAVLAAFATVAGTNSGVDARADSG